MSGPFNAHMLLARMLFGAVWWGVGVDNVSGLTLSCDSELMYPYCLTP